MRRLSPRRQAVKRMSRERFERLWQVTGRLPRLGPFCCGLVTIGDDVVDAPPLLDRLGMGRTKAAARAVARRHGFTVKHVRAYRA